MWPCILEIVWESTPHPHKADLRFPIGLTGLRFGLPVFYRIQAGCSKIIWRREKDDKKFVNFRQIVAENKNP